MRKVRLSKRPSPAMVVALAALFVSLGGTATAAGLLITGAQIKDGTVGGVDIRNSSLTGADVKDQSLAANDIRGPVTSAIQAQDAATVGGLGATAFAAAGHVHDDRYLGKTSKAADADKFDGYDSTTFFERIGENSTAGLESYIGPGSSRPSIETTFDDVYTTIASLDVPPSPYVVRGVAALSYSSSTSGEAVFVRCRLALVTELGENEIATVRQDFLAPDVTFAAVVPIQALSDVDQPATVALQCNGHGGPDGSWTAEPGTSVIAHRAARVERSEMP